MPDKANLPVELPTPRAWTQQTRVKGFFSRNPFGPDRGKTLVAIDRAYEQFHASRTPHNAYVLLQLMEAYVKRHGGIAKLDRNPGLFQAVMEGARQSVTLGALMEEPPLRANPKEWGRATNAEQDAADLHARSVIILPNARRDLITLLANVRIEPEWDEEQFQFAVLTTVSGLAVGCGMSKFLPQGTDQFDLGSNVVGLADFKDAVKDASAAAVEKAKVVKVRAPTERQISAALPQMPNTTVATPPPNLAPEHKSKWVMVKQFLEELARDFKAFLVRYARENFPDFMADAIQTAGKLIGMILAFLSERSAPFVQVGVSLGRNLYDTVKASLKAYEMRFPDAKVAPLTATMATIRDALHRQMRNDAVKKAASALLDAAKIAGEVMLAGATMWVNLVVDAFVWVGSIFFKLCEKRRVQGFLDEVRCVWDNHANMSVAAQYMVRGQDNKTASKVMLPVVPDHLDRILAVPPAELAMSKGEFKAASYQAQSVVFNEDGSFDHLMQAMCKASVFFPAIALASGVFENHDTDLLFGNSTDVERAPPKALAQGGSETDHATSSFLEMLRREAVIFLKERGFTVKFTEPDGLSPSDRERWDFVTRRLAQFA